MLNEIFKGMDNSSELINENFNELAKKLNDRLDWKKTTDTVAIGGNKTVAVNDEFSEVMLTGDLGNSLIFYKAIHELNPTKLIVKRVTNVTGIVFVAYWQFGPDGTIFISVPQSSAEGVTSVQYR